MLQTTFEYIIVGIVLIAIFGFMAIFAYSVYRKQEIQAEIAYNKYKLDRKKLYATSNRKSREVEDDEAQDFIDALPPWLASIAEGANVDLEALYDGEPSELAKVKELLDKNLPKGKSIDNEGLIG